MARTDRTATNLWYETLNYIQTPGIQTTWNNLKQTPIEKWKETLSMPNVKDKTNLVQNKIKSTFWRR